MSPSPHHLKSRLHGVIAFPPTPFADDERLDLDSLAAHLDFLCQSHVATIVVCGGVGEFYALDDDEFGHVVRTAVRTVSGRATLIAGVGHSTRHASRLAAEAANAGVDGLMVNPPYFVRPSEDGWYAHYASLADASGLGLMVFSTTGATHGPASLERLAHIPEVVAFKDETGDLHLFGELTTALGDRFAWINGMAESLLAPYVSLGAQAVTSGLVNLAPSLSHAMWDAAAASRWTALNDLQRSGPRALAQLRQRRNGYEIMVIKQALNELGRPGGGYGRLPLTPLTADDHAELRTLLARMGLLEPTVARV